MHDSLTTNCQENIQILVLSKPGADIDYADSLRSLEQRVRKANAAPYLYRQDRSFYVRNLSGETTNILAMEGDNIIGYTALRGMNPWPAYLDEFPYPPEQCGLFLFTLVDPNYRGRGIGKQLNLARYKAAQRAGFRYLFATVHPDNIANMTMLTNMGFRSLGQKPMFTEQLLRILLFRDLAAHESEYS